MVLVIIMRFKYDFPRYKECCCTMDYGQILPPRIRIKALTGIHFWFPTSTPLIHAQNEEYH